MVQYCDIKIEEALPKTLRHHLKKSYGVQITSRLKVKLHETDRWRRVYIAEMRHGDFPFVKVNGNDVGISLTWEVVRGFVD